MSLAHHGVLFLDELAEYRRNVLEALRQPMEEGAISLARAGGSVRFPARFLLVAAMNPCPCGYAADGTDRCLCDPAHVVRYQGRVSGPLLDRIDLHVHVHPVPFRALADRTRRAGGGRRAGRSDAASMRGASRDGASTEAASREEASTEEVRERVASARRVQTERFRGTGVHANAQMRPTDMRRWCRASDDALGLLQRAVDRAGLSARAYHRVLKVARTIADLAGSDAVRREHVAEALQFRSLDRATL